MQETTAGPTHGGTGSATIADIVSLAAERYGEQPAARFKRDGEWSDALVRRAGRDGLGDRPRADRPRPEAGDRVALLCTTRARVDVRGLRDHRRRRRRRPDLPHQLPRGVRVGGGQLRVALRRLRGRDAGGEDRRRPRPAPQARGDHLDRARPTARCRSTSCASAAAARDAAEVAARVAAVKPEDPYTIIYTSGTTGPPKGCVLTHGNYRQVTRMCEEIGVIEAGELVYLFLPLAHSYALLIQLLGVDLGAPLIYWSGDPNQIVPGPDGDQAGLPAVGAADLREDLHAGHVQQRPGEDRRRDPARPEGPADAGGRPGRARRAAGRVRQGRRRAVRQRPQHLRRQPQAGDLRRRPDRPARSSSSSTPAARPCSRATA